MDKFRAKTIVDYTGCDLNCKCVRTHPKTRRYLEKIFRRKARRKLKQELCKEIQKLKD